MIRAEKSSNYKNTYIWGKRTVHSAGNPPYLIGKRAFCICTLYLIGKRPFRYLKIEILRSKYWVQTHIGSVKGPFDGHTTLYLMGIVYADTCLIEMLGTDTWLIGKRPFRRVHTIFGRNGVCEFIFHREKSSTIVWWYVWSEKSPVSAAHCTGKNKTIGQVTHRVNSLVTHMNFHVTCIQESHVAHRV